MLKLGFAKKTLSLFAAIVLLVGCASSPLPTADVKVARVPPPAPTDDVKLYMAKTPDLQRHRLVLSIADQKMALLDRQSVVAVYPISTSLKPPSEKFDSGGTPRGLHVISEKLGAGQPAGMIFKYLEPTGVISELDPSGDPPVVSRVLRLRGLESTNQNTHERLIYLHGSPHEKLIGMPASGGCIRMSSRDVIALFNMIDVGTSISIVEQDLENAIAATLERERRFATMRLVLERQIKDKSITAKGAHSLCFGHMYGVGDVPQNYFEADRWCAVAGKLGAMSALVLLGEIREYGLAGTQLKEDALILYREAAINGHPFAQKKLSFAQGKSGRNSLGNAQKSELIRTFYSAEDSLTKQTLD